MAKRSIKKRGDLEQGCPVPNTHRRLISAHKLWHQALTQYANPDGFRTNLNATIQELRNITFVLQKEKRSIPDFEAWYAPHRASLSSDPLCGWAVDARNRVVKEGDLATRSRARVTAILDYGTAPTGEFDVPPLARTRAIAASFAATAPAHLRGAVSIVVERKWIAEDLPEHELLGALAHVFGRLSKIIWDAHSHVNCPFSPVRCRGRTEEDNALPPACMSAAEGKRTIIIRPHEAGYRQKKEIFLPARVTKRNMKALHERYGDPPDTKALKPGDPIGKTRALHEAASQALVIDGHHGDFVHLLLKDDTVGIRLMAASDRADYYLLWHHLAEEVNRRKSDAIIRVCEMWFALFDPSHPERHPSLSPGRREALQTVLATASGMRLVLRTFFHREDGKIVLQETEERQDVKLPFLDPVVRAWRKQAR